VAQLRQAAGEPADDLPTWEAFLQTGSLDASYRFLMERPKLAAHRVTPSKGNWLND